MTLDEDPVRIRSRAAAIGMAGERLAELRMRYPGFGEHRAIRHLELRPVDMAVAIGTSLLLGLAVLALQQPLQGWWRGQILDWSAYLQLPVAIDAAGYFSWHGTNAWPAVAGREFIAVSAGTLVVFGGTYLLADPLTPVKFALRILCYIQASALLVLGSGGAFGSPATAVPTHLAGLQGLGREVMLGAVVLTMLVEGVLRVPPLVRAAHAAVVLAYFAAAVPAQVVLHALLLDRVSLLLMPLLHLIFGVLLDVMLFVALISILLSDSVPAGDARGPGPAIHLKTEKK